MADRPILFSGPMVRALLNDTKTQTRRVVKPQPVANQRGKFNFTTFTDDEGIESYWQNYPFWGPVRCPYGQPGDRLWVRETWAHARHAAAANCVEDGPFVYAADGEFAARERLNPRWVPSIHMPRWASRITLEIVSVRVERLQDISEADARAEGVRQMNDTSGCWVSREGPGNLVTPWPKARDAYSDLWEQINGEGSWEKNPWIWVITFRRFEANHGST